jgi:long-chain acyl-CoA synthetase
MIRLLSDTVVALLEERACATPDAAATYHRDGTRWVPTSYAQYWSSIRSTGAGLEGLGLNPKDVLAIMAPVCREWDVMEKAALAAGLVVAGIDAHGTKDHINYIVRHSGARALFVDTVEQLDGLDRNALDGLDAVIVLKRTGNPEGFSGAGIVYWDELPVEGTCDCDNNRLPDGDDPATLVYTSGTTGAPKGIMYTHHQTMRACRSIVDALGPFDAKDKAICWLPLSNLFQRIMNLCAVCAGTPVYFVEDPRRIMDALVSVRPTVFVGVPRFYEKLYAGIKERLEGLPAGLGDLVFRAISVGKKRARGSKTSFRFDLLHGAVDVLVLRRLRKVLGGKMKFMLTGSARCPEEIRDFFDAIGIPLLEAYGITENIIPMSLNTIRACRRGSVGRPLKPNNVRIAADREVLVKGPGVFGGYHRGNGSGRKITEDGFLATGDYGHMDSDGFLYLHGRKSDIIKTSTGRRIAPARIEESLHRIPRVDRAVVVGNDRKLLTAIVSLETGRNGSGTPRPGDGAAALRRELERHNKALAPYERIRGLVVVSEAFSIQRGELTPSLKVRRGMIEKKYRTQIDGLYEQLDEGSVSSPVMVYAEGVA